MMDATIDLEFEGKQVVSWIKERKETGLIEVVFDTAGNEHVFNFEPDCFEAMAEAMNEFLETGKFEHRLGGTGRIQLERIGLDMQDDKRVTIEAVLEEQDNPFLKISSKVDGRLCLYFNEAQTKALSDTFKKLVELKQIAKDVQKKKTVKARTDST